MNPSERDEGLDKWPDYTRFLRYGSLRYVLIEDCDFLFNRVKELEACIQKEIDRRGTWYEGRKALEDET